MSKELWQQTAAELFQEHGSGSEGLSDAEVAEKEAKYGKNRLEEGKKKSPFRIFLEQFADLLVIILIIAAVISMISGNIGYDHVAGFQRKNIPGHHIFRIDFHNVSVPQNFCFGRRHFL